MNIKCILIVMIFLTCKYSSNIEPDCSGCFPFQVAHVVVANDLALSISQWKEGKEVYRSCANPFLEDRGLKRLQVRVSRSITAQTENQTSRIP